jgi:hypothetical protein
MQPGSQKDGFWKVCRSRLISHLIIRRDRLSLSPHQGCAATLDVNTKEGKLRAPNPESASWAP